MARNYPRPAFSDVSHDVLITGPDARRTATEEDNVSNVSEDSRPRVGRSRTVGVLLLISFLRRKSHFEKTGFLGSSLSACFVVCLSVCL